MFHLLSQCISINYRFSLEKKCFFFVKFKKSFDGFHTFYPAHGWLSFNLGTVFKSRSNSLKWRKNVIFWSENLWLWLINVWLWADNIAIREKKTWLSLHFILFHFALFEKLFWIFYLLFFLYFSFFSIFIFVFISVRFWTNLYYYLLLGGFCVHWLGFHLFLYNFRNALFAIALSVLHLFCITRICTDECARFIALKTKQRKKIDYNRCTCFCRFKERITFAWSANKSKASGQYCSSIIAQYGCIDWK